MSVWILHITLDVFVIQLLIFVMEFHDMILYLNHKINGEGYKSFLTLNGAFCLVLITKLLRLSEACLSNVGFREQIELKPTSLVSAVNLCMLLF